VRREKREKGDQVVLCGPVSGGTDGLDVRDALV